MVRRGRRLAGAGALVVVLSACGTALPNKDFDTLGSGKALTVTGPNGTQAGPGGTTASTGPGGTATGPGGTGPTGTTGTSGTKGTKGTSGHNVPGGGTGPQGRANTAGCAGAKNNDPNNGVTTNSVTVGMLYSGAGNPFAPNQFVVSYYGGQSYFRYINQQGGICGRQITIKTCDDNGDRNKDVSCVHQLIDNDHVLALAASNVYQYTGAPYVSQKGVPDVGGQPITGSAYYTYPHLYGIQADYYLNNGSPPSQYWGNWGLFKYFKAKLHLTRVGVIEYAQTDSQRGARFVAGSLQRAGVKVDVEQVPLAGDPSAQVSDMQSNHDQAIFDALDLSGNQRVCKSMQQARYNVPKISTVAAWTQQLGQTLGPYPCLSNYYAWGLSTNYADASNPQVKLFQQAYGSFAPGAPLSQWSVEGWAAAMWLSDAIKSCGNTVTRACVEKYVFTKTGYSARGLIDPNVARFPRYSHAPPTLTTCNTVVKWAGGAGGTWSTVVDHKNNCSTTPTLIYSAS